MNNPLYAIDIKYRLKVNKLSVLILPEIKNCIKILIEWGYFKNLIFVEQKIKLYFIQEDEILL